MALLSIMMWHCLILFKVKIIHIKQYCTSKYAWCYFWNHLYPSHSLGRFTFFFISSFCEVQRILAQINANSLIFLKYFSGLLFDSCLISIWNHSLNNICFYRNWIWTEGDNPSNLFDKYQMFKNSTSKRSGRTVNFDLYLNLFLFQERKNSSPLGSQTKQSVWFYIQMLIFKRVWQQLRCYHHILSIERLSSLLRLFIGNFPTSLRIGCMRPWKYVVIEHFL